MPLHASVEFVGIRAPSTPSHCSTVRPLQKVIYLHSPGRAAVGGSGSPPDKSLRKLETASYPAPLPVQLRTVSSWSPALILGEGRLTDAQMGSTAPALSLAHRHRAMPPPSWNFSHPRHQSNPQNDGRNAELNRKRVCVKDTIGYLPRPRSTRGRREREEWVDEAVKCTRS